MSALNVHRKERGFMKIGFIGTGAIAEAMVCGMIRHGEFQDEVFVSLRSEHRSQKLANEFSNVSVLSENQKIIDRSDWVFLSVLPNQAESLLQKLTFRAEQTVFSLIAGLNLDGLRRLISAENVFRIIPLPPVELGVGPIPLIPPDKVVCEFLNRFATCVEVTDEVHFSKFSAASAAMASFFEMQASLARWLKTKDIPAEASAQYTTATYEALCAMSSQSDWDELQQLSDHTQTVGGLNEQVINELRELGWFEMFTDRIERISKRLDG